MSAIAKDKDRHEEHKAIQRHEEHKAIERHEHHEQVKNHERERWAQQHREHERHDAAHEREHREAMHRYDREHHKPVVARHHEPERKGLDHGKKTGWHGQPVPPKHEARVTHRPERKVPPPAPAQHGMVRHERNEHIAQAR
jgi:hypothetical protein